MDGCPSCLGINPTPQPMIHHALRPRGLHCDTRCMRENISCVAIKHEGLGMVFNCAEVLLMKFQGVII